MKRVAGISLGSSKRDSTSRVTILGREFEISRSGTDGDMKRFAEMVRELDGKVDAIGLGGMDRYYWIGERRYTVRDADRLAQIAQATPVVDGSGVKNTLERETIGYLQLNGIVDFAKSKVLMVAAVDRFGMAQAISETGADVVYGDLIFTMGVPIAMRSYRTVYVLGSLLLPVIVKLPLKWFYPTGSSHDRTKPKHQKYYDWADVIAGDFHLIRKHLPAAESGLLGGKVIITNTVTEQDADALKERGVRLLVTSTPKYDGRHYATNVLEGVLINLFDKAPDDVTADDYKDLLERMEWKPTIVELNP